MPMLKYELVTLLMAAAGVALGIYFPEISLSLEFIGKIFIQLLKMLIIPLVVTSVFLAIARLKGPALKRLGLGTAIYYFFTSAMAALTGLLIANLIDFRRMNSFQFKLEHHFDPSKLASVSFGDVAASFFSGNFFNALSEGNIVQIIVFTLIVSFAALNIEASKRKALLEFSQAIQDLMAQVIAWIVKIAPLGIFSLLAAIVAKTDVAIFKGLSSLFIAITAAAVVHAAVTLPLIAKLVGRFNVLSFISQVREALMLALSTASSAATLPVSQKVLEEKAGVSKETAGFILPLGATLNMDGSALYQSLVIIFLGEYAGMDLTIYQQSLIFIFVMTSSAGTAGIPGGGLMMVGAVMQMTGIPLEMIGVYLLIDRFWDYPITMINVFGDLVGAKTLDRFHASQAPTVASQ